MPCFSLRMRTSCQEGNEAIAGASQTKGYDTEQERQGVNKHRKGKQQSGENKTEQVSHMVSRSTSKAVGHEGKCKTYGDLNRDNTIKPTGLGELCFALASSLRPSTLPRKLLTMLPDAEGHKTCKFLQHAKPEPLLSHHAKPATHVPSSANSAHLLLYASTAIQWAAQRTILACTYLLNSADSLTYSCTHSAM